MKTLSARAQINNDFLSRTGPRPSFETPEPANYNLKWGNLPARIFGSVQTEWNDNINFSDQQPEWDWSFEPHLRIGFVWPIDPEHTLQLNLSMGYRWYLNHPELDTFIIEPTSRIDHKIAIGDVQIVFSDRFSVQVDPTSRGELSNTSTNSLMNFRRISNTVGVLANWQPTSDFGMSASYDFTIDRSLNGEFTQIDRNAHIFTAGAYQNLTVRSTVGVFGDYIINQYEQNIQNDGTQYSIGPLWNYRLSQFAYFNARIAYAVARFDQTGTINDTSDFHGIVYQFTFRQDLNRTTSHYVHVNSSPGLGFQSNFTDFFTVQYGLNTRLTSYLLLNTTFSYENLKASGTSGENADRYLFYIGASAQVTRRWTLALGYAMSLKNSDIANQDYRQNRVTLELARQF